MKIKTLLFLIVTFCIFNIVTVLAAETVITLDSAVLNGSTITVSGKLQNAVDNQQISFMATDILDNTYNKDGIFYMDQQTAMLDADGNFKVSFNINKLLSDESIYIVRFGGTNIITPAQMLITTGAETELILGDVNLDGNITAADAALTLQNVLYQIDYLTEKQIKAMRVTKSEVITSDNAAQILAKALDAMYVFPVNQ